MKMVDNVIPFERRILREAADNADQERKAALDRMRAEEIHQRLKREPRIQSLSDRFHVARNLDDILSEMEVKSGMTCARLLRQIHMGHEEDSTKQLYNYTVAAEAVFDKS